MTIKPDRESIAAVSSFIEANMDEAGVGAGDLSKINIAVDELYSNIVFYSGAVQAEAICEVTEKSITVTLRDNGTPYDPLLTNEPDLTADPLTRPEGGLGILLVKKLMSDVRYNFTDGWNEIQIRLDRTFKECGR